MKEHKVLASFSDEEREKAMKKYQIISPYLEGQMPLYKIAAHSNYSIRTMRYWLKHYRDNGLVGLLAKQRRDKGDRAYSNKYDLIYLREAEYSNKIWQADHTMLDIEVINAKGLPERPWLTVVIDDYSRAIAGYYIDFGNPDTLEQH
ncbi:helix-turn-helix domain-containing protein [Bacillus cereus]|uniref:helix-turn-helix domain-containing protein n=1 Tax=Bacillus cereus TaxID=1396 RepID=UPI000BEE6A73|nr:helix-turn-helix domain-containing protein [Bacillus cereus]PEF61488.1 hypothetical protein CON35_24990 [Bacillus cereus]